MPCCGRKKYKTQVESTLRKRTKSCLETDIRKTESQIPKCHKRKRLVKPRECLSELEKILLRIQPPIADRERYLEPLHVNCFLENSKKIVVKRCTGSLCNEARKRSKNRSCFKDAEDANKSSAKTKVKPGNGNAESRRKGPKSKSKTKRKAKTNQQRSTKKKKAEAKDTDSDTSIHSIDSKICLAGVSLTREDKRTIEENRQRIHRKSKEGDKPPSISDENEENADGVDDEKEEA